MSLFKYGDNIITIFLIIQLIFYFYNYFLIQFIFNYFEELEQSEFFVLSGNNYLLNSFFILILSHLYNN